MLPLTRRLGYVPRWAVIPTIKKQNVAEHSYHVANTVLWLMRYSTAVQSNSVDPFLLLKEALEHDAEEAITGDYPSPAKDKYFTNDQITVILKLADCLEAAAFLQEEICLGNSAVYEIYDDVHKNIERWLENFRITNDIDKGQLVVKYLNEVTPKKHPCLGAARV